MGYLRGYEFVKINKNINKYLDLSKEIWIYFDCWDPIPEEELYFHKVLNLAIDKTEHFKISKESLNIKSKLLTEQENKKLNNYLSEYGNNLLDYELRKVNYENLKYLPNND